MTQRVLALAAALATFTGVLAPGSQALAADPVGGTYRDTVYQGDTGSVCGHKQVLNTIARRFRHQVTYVPNLPDVGIEDFYGVQQTRYLPEREDNPIARQYCKGNVRLSDGRARSIWYMIEYGQGFASIGENVEFCVSGFDRWKVYDGYCRVLR